YKHVQKYAVSYKVSNFVNLDKSDIFSDLESSLKPECSEYATEKNERLYNMKFNLSQSQDSVKSSR
ncbi:hypothetical protein EMCG_00584, partial [[Emmonsia] crescens]